MPELQTIAALSLAIAATLYLAQRSWKLFAGAGGGCGACASKGCDGREGEEGLVQMEAAKPKRLNAGTGR